jgi:hypothetical protein
MPTPLPLMLIGSSAEVTSWLPLRIPALYPVVSVPALPPDAVAPPDLPALAALAAVACRP